MAVLRGSEMFVEKTNYEQLIKAASVVQGFKDANWSPEVYDKNFLTSLRLLVNLKTENICKFFLSFCKNLNPQKFPTATPPLDNTYRRSFITVNIK